MGKSTSTTPTTDKRHTIRAGYARKEVFVSSEEPTDQVYNPWTVVNLVFEHLVEQGLHPTLGEADDPGEAGAALLRALGVVPGIDSGGLNSSKIHNELAVLRAAILEQE